MSDRPLIALAVRKGMFAGTLGYGAQRSQLAALAKQLTGTSYLHAGEALTKAGPAIAAHLTTLPDWDHTKDAF